MTRRGRKRMSPEARAAVVSAAVKLYKAGRSIRQICDEIDQSYGFVRRVLDESEVEFRGRGGSRAHTALQPRSKGRFAK